MCRVIVYNRLKLFPDGFGGFLRNHLTLYLFPVLEYHIAVGIRYMVYNIGGYQFTAVNGSGIRGNQLQRSQFVCLTEGTGRQVNQRHSILLDTNTGNFTRQIYAGFFLQAEAL